MISYEPLLQTLKEKNVEISEFRDLMSSRTVSKINKNEHMSTKSIEKICLYLDVQPHRVFRIIKE
jgi:DNA-binding Xre family transcriptional regulator